MRTIKYFGVAVLASVGYLLMNALLALASYWWDGSQNVAVITFAPLIVLTGAYVMWVEMEISFQQGRLFRQDLPPRLFWQLALSVVLTGLVSHALFPLVGLHSMESAAGWILFDWRFALADPRFGLSVVVLILHVAGLVTIIEAGMRKITAGERGVRTVRNAPSNAVVS
ncbi:MAG: hypothetical protein KBB55_00565 [Candidatus Buchananbacteria bacterium]|nr:hypothetical protein [Candidatus Buchananbacteria bacterium]